MDGRQWEDLTHEERTDPRLSYRDILRLRGAAYARQVKRMEKAGGVPEAMTTWAAHMAKRYGPLVRVWENEVWWIEGFLIALYGEEPAHWPAAFSDADVLRAKGWLTGRPVKGEGVRAKGGTPKGVAYLDAPPESGVADAGILALLGTTLGLASGGTVALLGVALGLVWVLSALTNFWENELIDHLFRARSYTAPTDHFIALYTAAPGETGGGTEVSGGSYARVQVAAGSTNWEGTGGETTNVDSAGTGGATQNRNAITFPTPSANWGLVTHFASLDASSSGNFYFYGALTNSKNINNGDPAPAFQAGSLDFALA